MQPLALMRTKPFWHRVGKVCHSDLFIIISMLLILYFNLYLKLLIVVHSTLKTFRRLLLKQCEEEFNNRTKASQGIFLLSSLLIKFCLIGRVSNGPAKCSCLAEVRLLCSRHLAFAHKAEPWVLIQRWESHGLAVKIYEVLLSCSLWSLKHTV